MSMSLFLFIFSYEPCLFWNKFILNRFFLVDKTIRSLFISGLTLFYLISLWTFSMLFGFYKLNFLLGVFRLLKNKAFDIYFVNVFWLFIFSNSSDLIGKSSFKGESSFNGEQFSTIVIKSKVLFFYYNNLIFYWM